MVINERPGVYSSIDVSSSITGSRMGRTVGIAAAAALGVKGECKRITSYGEAVTAFGKDCSLTELARILFMNGAAAIEAVPAVIGGAVPLKADYEAAFAVLMKKEKVSVMLCDSTAADIHNAMRLAIEGGTEGCKYRIGIVEAVGEISTLSAKAGALNSERMVMVYPGESGVGARVGAVAAALAGVIAAGGDPALPVNGAELVGLENFLQIYSDADINTLVQAGITPIESVGGKNCVVRGITTKTTTGGEADVTWRELTTVLIVDDVIPSVRAALRVKFPRVKNTAQTRGAIRTQVIIELESKLKQEIIDSYGAVSAVADVSDPTVCIVSFEFAVAHGLNRINLTAHISV
ncbi:MAG: phage tail sheath protein [Oscillospiraceae bacterium]